MDLYAFPPIAAILDAAYAAFTGLAQLLEPLAGATAAAAAIVLVTLIVRAVLIPVGVSQAKAEQTRARLAPRLRVLQERHRKNPERLQREMMQLYADEKTSPLAGCVPLLLQAPVIAVVYAVFLHPTIAGHANTLLTEQLFGVQLGTSAVGAAAAGALDPAVLLVFGVLLAVIVAVAEITRRVFRPRVDPGQAGSPLANPAALRLVGALQFATAIVALFVPLAAALYLTVTVAWTLVQRVLLRRVYPLPAV